jgi:hypothetical protein
LPLQTLPQEPQLEGSSWKSTHAPPQHCRLSAHTIVFPHAAPPLELELLLLELLLLELLLLPELLLAVPPLLDDELLTPPELLLLPPTTPLLLPLLPLLPELLPPPLVTSADASALPGGLSASVSAAPPQRAVRPTRPTKQAVHRKRDRMTTSRGKMTSW